MDNQLMVGILLIIVGIAVGLIAAALVLNRREDQISAEMDEDNEDEQPADAVEQEAPPEVEAEAEADEVVEVDQVKESPDETPRERQLIAEVYREEVTGKLIIRAGDHEYSDGKQIDNEAERRRLAYAASDLADWFQGEFEFGGQPAAASSQQPSSPDQMLEEINEILQRSLINTPERGVRLSPDAVGGVKVLIGVKSYEIDDVPDKKIRDLIRQAVAEWEASQ